MIHQSLSLSLTLLSTSVTLFSANKHILNKTTLPLSFLYIQLIIQQILFKILNKNKTRSRNTRLFAAFYIVGLSLNTICLSRVDPSVYLISRSLVYPFQYLLRILVYRFKFKYEIGIHCLVILVGFGVGVQTYSDGVLYGVLSSLVSAVYNTLVTRRQNGYELVYSNCIYGCLFMLPIWLIIESVDFFRFGVKGLASFLFKEVVIDGNVISNNGIAMVFFIVAGICTGFLGFMLNIGFPSINSPMRQMLSSSARGSLQAIMAFCFFGEVITFNKVIGLCLGMLGTGMFVYQQGIEMERGGKGYIL